MDNSSVLHLSDAFTDPPPNPMVSTTRVSPRRGSSPLREQLVSHLSSDSEDNNLQDRCRAANNQLVQLTGELHRERRRASELQMELDRREHERGVQTEALRLRGALEVTLLEQQRDRAIFLQETAEREVSEAAAVIATLEQEKKAALESLTELRSKYVELEAQNVHLKSDIEVSANENGELVVALKELRSRLPDIEQLQLERASLRQLQEEKHNLEILLRDACAKHTNELALRRDQEFVAHSYMEKTTALETSVTALSTEIKVLRETATSKDILERDLLRVKEENSRLVAECSRHADSSAALRECLSAIVESVERIGDGENRVTTLSKEAHQKYEDFIRRFEIARINAEERLNKLAEAAEASYNEVAKSRAALETANNAKKSEKEEYESFINAKLKKLQEAVVELLKIEDDCGSAQMDGVGWETTFETFFSAKNKLVNALQRVKLDAKHRVTEIADQLQYKYQQEVLQRERTVLETTKKLSAVEGELRLSLNEIKELRKHLRLAAEKSALQEVENEMKILAIVSKKNELEQSSRVSNANTETEVINARLQEVIADLNKAHATIKGLITYVTHILIHYVILISQKNVAKKEAQTNRHALQLLHSVMWQYAIVAHGLQRALPMPSTCISPVVRFRRFSSIRVFAHAIIAAWRLKRNALSVSEQQKLRAIRVFGPTWAPALVPLTCALSSEISQNSLENIYNELEKRNIAAILSKYNTDYKRTLVSEVRSSNFLFENNSLNFTFIGTSAKSTDLLHVDLISVAGATIPDFLEYAHRFGDLLRLQFDSLKGIVIEIAAREAKHAISSRVSPTNNAEIVDAPLAWINHCKDGDSAHQMAIELINNMKIRRQDYL